MQRVPIREPLLRPASLVSSRMDESRLLLGSRWPEDLAILQRLRRDAELFFEFLNGRPGVDLLHYEVRLRVHLRIVNRHAELEVVVIDPPVPLLDFRIHAAWIATFIDPRVFVEAGSCDDERVVVGPPAD